MRTHDVAIVLGGGIDAEGQLPREVPHRVKRGLAHYWAGHVGHVILSGGLSHRIDFTPPRTEAEAMLECALELGAPPDILLNEAQSTGTISEAVETKVNCMMPNDWKSAIIVGAQGHTFDRLAFVFQRVWGPDYNILVDVSKVHQGAEIKRHERRALLLSQTLLARIPDGDHEAVAKLLATQRSFVSYRRSRKSSSNGH